MISISVVIPTCGRPALLDRAIASVVEQRRSDIEIIVVDDNPENPVKLHSKYAGNNIKIIHNEKNMGVARSRNRGIGAASAKWIAFLDDDDLWRPGFVDATLAALESAPSEVAFSWCSIANVDHDETGMTIGVRPRIFAKSCDREKTYQDALSIGTSWGFTVGRRCFDLIGQFDPSYKLIEDTELIMRMVAADLAAVVVPEVLVEIHHHSDPGRPTSASRNRERAAEISRMLEQNERLLAVYPRIEDGFRRYADQLLSDGTAS